MKIIDKEISFFGRDFHLRIVPKNYRSHLCQVGTLLLRSKFVEAEKLLDQMRNYFCHNGQDDTEMVYYRDQINYNKSGISL